MLGTLAKWLRIIGYDTAYGEGNDSEIIKKADTEERILFTRDKELHDRYVNSVFVGSTKLEEQIKEVINALKLKIDMGNALSRCTLCNAPIMKTSKEQAKGKVPPHAYETHDNFWICPKCKRIYWMGTHWDNMKRFIEKLKDELP